jgi:hypothetical protein
LLILVFFASATGWAQLRITEFMASNGRTLKDDFGAYEDWIELYNAGSVSLNLEGWSLTDEAANPAKWKLPGTNLAARSFLVVFASGRDRRLSGAVLHANFKLATEGEYLALVEPSGATRVSEFTPAYPAQYRDISYAAADLRANELSFGYATAATPGAPNATTYPGVAAAVQFSVRGGVFTSNLQVTLSCATPGAALRYTLDNRAPSESSTLYTGPLSIAGSAAIRARAFVPGWVPGPIRTEAYTLLDASLQGFSSRLPLVILNAYNRTIAPDMAERVPATLTVIDTTKLSARATLLDKPDYHGRVGVEGRGQTSWGFPKKPYNLELRDEEDRDEPASLIGMPAGSDWVLLNLYNDKTFMNDFLAHELFELMGHYAVRRRHVEVFLNGTRPGGNIDNSPRLGMDDYVGVYLLLEKIRIAPDRVDISPLTPLDTAEPEVSGGYIFKKDKDSPGDVNFTTGSGQVFKFHDPKGQDLTEIQRTWLRNHLSLFETALYGSNWRDPALGYARFIDLDSFVDNHWIVEFTKQIDGYRLSNHLHKDRGGKIKMSPIWDWNLSFGNADYLQGEFPQGWYWPLISAYDHLWLRRLIADPGDLDFRQRLVDRWSVLRTNIFNPTRLLARMDELASLLDEPQARDFQRWPRLGTYVWPNPGGLASARTYPEVLRWTKGWLTNRFAWIDSQHLKSPGFAPFGGPVAPGTRVTLSAIQGTIYYTLNGSDPRQAGGAVSSQATRYSGPITLTANTRIIARASLTNGWSGPAIATFVTATPPLVVTELMYHPAPPSEGSPFAKDDFQFIELCNVGEGALDLAGFRFSRGVRFTFAGGRLGAGQRIVLVKNRAAFESRYGAALSVGGTFTNSLAQGGERIVLTGPLDEPVLDFSYDKGWYPITDGLGFSLVVVNQAAPGLAWNERAQWRPSAAVGGSPGEADLAPGIVPVVINEILTRPEPPQLDAIELFNPSVQVAAIGGWFLTDDRANPKKFRIPAGTAVGPGSYLVFDETHFNLNPGSPASFALSAYGEEVYLFSADAAGNLTGYLDGFRFGAATPGVTFGRYTNSLGEVHHPAQVRSTLSSANAGPRVGPVVVNEIQYAPAAGEVEFVELKNVSDEPVPLFDPVHPINTWRLEGTGFEFPPNVVLAPRGLLVLTGGDPDSFRERHRIPIRVPVLGPFSGRLQRGGELLELQRPDPVGVDSNGAVVIPRIAVDRVRYDDAWPWPTNAAGFGPSLERIAAHAYGNDPANWRASLGNPSPGLPNDINRAPVVNAGSDLEITATTFPAFAVVQGSAADDGLPNPPGSVGIRWSQVSGPSELTFEVPGQLATAVTLPAAGTYVLRLTVSDGELEGVDDLQIVASRPVTRRTLVAAGSEWRYWDLGSEPPGDWRQASYNDSAWKTGKAPLGYGEGDEATVLSFGPNSQAKYTTSYFRRTFQLLRAAAVRSLNLRVVRDDGVVVYLNGQEVFRDNLPEGLTSFATWALNAISGADETTFLEREALPSMLRNGANIVAIEMHQVNGTSSDLRFDFALEAFAEIDDVPLSIRASMGSGAPIEIMLNGEPGVSYFLEFKDDLRASAWTPLTSGTAGQVGLLTLSDPSPRAGTRFYRVRISP